MNQRIIVGVTGASGSVYAEKLIEVLLETEAVDRVYLVATDSGRQVVRHELDAKREGFSLARLLDDGKKSPLSELKDFSGKLRLFKNDDLFAPIASGSASGTQMVVLPCSMGSLGRIANGMSSNLLERAADVLLKESRPLIVSPRETPFNTIHLSNMTKLAEAGAKIAPAMPAFYNKPKSIEELVDFVVARILDLMSIDSQLLKRWNSRLI